MRVVLGDEAVADAEEAVDWYVDHDAWPAAQRFQLEIGKALARIAEHPGLGTPGPSKTRTLPLHRFPYSVVYRASADEIRVIAVAAHRRRPGFWRRRG
jgi:plasmid stabilization system protein ParE